MSHGAVYTQGVISGYDGDGYEINWKLSAKKLGNWGGIDPHCST